MNTHQTGFHKKSRIIPTSLLKKTDIPKNNINWKYFSEFALSFDPLAENLTKEDLIEIGKNIPNKTQNIKVLRAQLYNWQRIWNNKTYPAPQSFLMKMNEIIFHIYQKVN